MRLRRRCGSLDLTLCRDGQHKGLQPRHARLAVGAAVSFIDFVTETYRERQFKEEAVTAKPAMAPRRETS